MSRALESTSERGVLPLYDENKDEKPRTDRKYSHINPYSTALQRMRLRRVSYVENAEESVKTHE